ncbi:MAG: chondroitinase, partial [Lentisphaeraceae bacterium]|nr:chondroitinase [Lentisphaeraceae bacterium]
MNIITQRYEQMIDKTVKVNDAEMARLRSKFRAYGFNGPAGNSQGTPVLFIEHVFIYNFEEHKSQSIKKFADVRYYTRDMLSIARAYRSCKKSSWAVELKNIFIDMYKNMHHYGWASGSGLGTLHHLGYSFRDYYGALFLMREALQQAGLRQQAQQDMYWYSGCGKIYEPFEKSGYANIDILNTTALGQLASVLMIENERERKSQLYAYQHWLNLGLAVAPGLKAPLKVDGSLYHHYNHYTLYGRDALNGITPVIYLLSGGPFRLAEKNHRALNKSLYMMRNYSNRIHYSLAASGRHPSGKNTLSQTPYYWMAKAGTADGKSAIDKKMASMFMRLGQSNLKKYASRIKEFSSRGIQIEEAPTGNWSMNYACQGIHRRDNWLFTVKGFSRYLWGSEIYQGANHYGRYLSYGHTQVLDENGRSGFSEAGWDWNRLPGTTTTVLPFEKLRADIQQVDEQSGREELLLSDEAFAGSLSFKGNGIFAMKLHSHPKYTGELRALKSYFMFDNMVLSLGSGISSTDKIHSTQTTLLQTAIKNEKVAFSLQNKLI